MELPNRDLVGLLQRGLLVKFIFDVLALVKPEQTYVVGVLVVQQTLDLILKLLGPTSGHHFELETVWQGDFLLKSVQAAVDSDESELAVQNVSAEILEAIVLSAHGLIVAFSSTA